MANHHQNSSLLKVPKILYHTYCWSYPPYPSLSHFSWCYPTNCCIEWPFSIIDIPCYGCSKPATFPPFFNAKGRKASPNGELSSTGHFAPMGLHPLGGAPRIYLWSTSITTGNHQLFMGKKNELNRPYSIANCDLNYQSRQRHPGNCRDPKQPQLMGIDIYIYTNNRRQGFQYTSNPWLVGGTPTSLKNMKVNGKDYPIYYGK